MTSFSPSGLRISLRELLLLFTAVCLGCAALKYANRWWAAIIPTIVVASLVVASITAILDRGARQAWAVGFAMAILIYVAALLAEDKLEPYTRLLTSELTSLMYDAVEETLYFDVSLDVPRRKALSLEELPPGARFLPRGQGYNPDAIGPGQLFSRQRLPLREYFDSVGHCLWALLFGYVGGRYGRRVYSRRVREQAVPKERP